DESFIELYVPVLAPGSQRVLGVIEFYKRPASLLRAKAQLRGYLLWGAGLAGALLFAVLYGQVLRAARTIHRQQAQLVEKETLAAIGEMSSAVAHGLRNPLASIRSSAELIQVGDLPLAREAAGDIVDQTDRLDRWVNELLSYTRPMDARLADVNLTPLLAACEAEFSCELARRKIALDLQIPADLPPVRAHPLLLGQALRSVLANAIEAAGSAGRVAVRASVTLAEADPDAGARPHRSAARVQLVVSDNGPGMSPSELSRVGQPFHTTKPRGLGVGLALARRVLDRFGGNLQIRSRSGVGTEVLLEIPALPLSTPAPR
ncbi:MAG: hypothetical protein RL722_2891, partial [Pseudomonadota bacterium]